MWRTSSRSEAMNCVEVNLNSSATSISEWCKSTFSEMTSCVEVAHDDGQVLVRDSKHPNALTVSFSVEAWEVLLDAVRVGLSVWHWLGAMEFSTGEKIAFERGVLAGEFDLKRLREDDNFVNSRGDGNFE